MDETDRSDVLRRKARIGREEHQARVMSPQRAMRLGMARAADDLFDLPLSVSAVQLETAGQTETLKAFRDTDLLMVLDGPEGAIGAASVEMPILAGLIEMQTMGHLLSVAPEPRAPTQTDAALMAPLLDASLEGFVENLADSPEAQWGDGVRFGARVESARMLSLLLEAPDFHLFRLDIALGEGARVGGLVIALPVPVSAPIEAQAHGDGNSPGAREVRMGQGALLAAEAPLTAVLHRIRMPLARVSELAPGDRLLIPRDALSDTRLEAGKESAMRKCRLGQINGFRAVRLSMGADGTLIGGAPEAEEPEENAAPGAPPTAPQAKAGARGTHAPDRAGNGGEAGRKAAPLRPSARAQDVAGATSDLPDLGDLGDLGDLPELALDG